MTFARIRALAVVGALVVAALVLVTIAIAKDRQGPDQARSACPKDAVLANLRLPEAKDVKLNVFNATGRPGLADQVGNDFRNRKFNVQKVDSVADTRAKGVAVVRYGPKAVGSAWLVRAYFLDEAETDFDIKRQDDVVDVVIGPLFRQLGTATEVNQAIAQMGKPQLPAGTCDSGAR
jgi:hypothetical protein